MALTELSKATLRILQDEINAAMQSIATKHGVSIKMAGGTFEPLAATLKVKVSVLQTADGRSGAEAAFAKDAMLAGLEPLDYGRRFLFRDAGYTIKGVKFGRRKTSVICTRADGKEFLFNASDVRTFLGKPARTLTLTTL